MADRARTRLCPSRGFADRAPRRRDERADGPRPAILDGRRRRRDPRQCGDSGDLPAGHDRRPCPTSTAAWLNNTPISHAVELGASDVWVIPAGTACGLESAPTSSLAMALQALSLLINRRLQRDIAVFDGRCDLRVLPPSCPVTVSPTDFGKARELIDRSYEQSIDWLSSDVDRQGADHLAHVLEHAHARA